MQWATQGVPLILEDRGKRMGSRPEGQSKKAKLDASRYYRNSLRAFVIALEEAIVTSSQLEGHHVSNRRFWASVLFTRLCTTGVSILWLCPRGPLNPDGLDWDSSSVLSLVRNLFECELVLFYLGTEPVGEEERKARLRVMQLHDCMERFRMFKDSDPAHKNLGGFRKQADELQALLLGNSFFTSLPDKLKKKLLKGEQASILSQDEILRRMGAFEQRFRGYYRFLSSHAHSFPLAFYRMVDQGRGRGVENEVDKGYVAGAIDFASEVVSRATAEIRGAFKGVVTFKPGKYDWGVHRRKQ